MSESFAELVCVLITILVEKYQLECHQSAAAPQIH